MSADKLAAIHSYLSRAFPRRFIEQRADWDRDAQSFKVHLERGTLLLKISDEVIHDNTPEQLMILLERWDVAALLSKDSTVGVLVSTGGPSAFERI